VGHIKSATWNFVIREACSQQNKVEARNTVHPLRNVSEREKHGVIPKTNRKKWFLNFFPQNLTFSKIPWVKSTLL